MTEPVDVSKIQVGDHVLLRHKVTAVFDKYTVRRPLELTGGNLCFWARTEEVVKHEPRGLRIGDTVQDWKGKTGTVAALFIEDNTACIKLHVDGVYVVRTLLSLTRIKGQNS